MSKPKYWWCVKDVHGFYVWSARCTKKDALAAFEGNYLCDIADGESVVKIRVEEVKKKP